jgi:hypothetical protein
MLINISFQIVPVLAPDISTGFTSYIVSINSIRVSETICNHYNLACFLLSNICEQSSSKMIYAVSAHSNLYFLRLDFSYSS